MGIRGAVVTVSSTRTEKDDESGEIVREILERDGIKVSFRRIVPDRMDAIQHACREAIGQADMVVFTGGTGLTRDDCTVEAIDPLLEKRIEGFGELFRWLSYQEIGTAAILSRALAGVVGGRAVFCIPGSPNAARLATERLIAPEVRHILMHARR